MVAQMARTNTLLQSMVADEFRGRIMAVYGIMLMGMMPFGALLAGHAATWVGSMATVGIGGAITVLAGLFFLFQNRKQ